MNNAHWILRLISHFEIYQDRYVFGTVVIGGLATIALLFLTGALR